MTVAVSCNLADGVVLGVDSAITLNDAQGNVTKIYENAEKLFQLGQRPIGIAAFGLGSLGARSVGSYIRQFEREDPNGAVSHLASIQSLVEELRKFFLQAYYDTVVPLVVQQTGKPFAEIPPEKRPILGLAVAGFSAGAYFSQVWELLIPIHDKEQSANQCRKEGQFGSNWFSLNEPIHRYVKGYDRGLMRDLLEYFAKLLNRPFTADEQSALQTLINRYEYPIPFFGMPIDEGIAHVKFLVETVINHHRFALGAPIVGGKVQIGLVTYKGENFKIL